MSDLHAQENLLRHYEGRRVFHGEMHDHSASGGTSDGKCPLSTWRTEMARLKMDFAAILDHRQVRHMYHIRWHILPQTHLHHRLHRQPHRYALPDHPAPP